MFCKNRFFQAVAFLTLVPFGPLFAFSVYVTNSGSDSVSIIDSTTQMVVGSPISVGNNPKGIAISPDNTFAYVTNYSDNTVSVIDIATNMVIGSPIAVGDHPIAVVFHPTQPLAYVVDEGLSTGDVSVIDTATGMVTDTIPMEQFPNALAITPDGAFLYVSNEGSDEVIVVDTATNMTVGSPISIVTRPNPIAITPNGSFAYVASGMNGKMFIIDTTTNMVVGSVMSLGGGINSISITPDGTLVYVLSGMNSNVVRVDTATNMVVGSPIPTQLFPNGSAITPDGSFLYVANINSDSVSVIDLSSNTVITNIGVLTSPFGVAILGGVSPEPPASISGFQKKNDFGIEYELFNTIEWSESPSDDVAGYNIYRDGGFIARVSATTFRYQDHNRPRGVTTTYEVATVNSSGDESSGLVVTIVGK